MGLSSIFTFLLLALRLFSLQALAAPAPAAQIDARADGWWFSTIQRQGNATFGSADYKVFRNVKDYGAVGDGTTDDTVAINKAISDMNRCGLGCDSSTTVPAIVYFPAGTYAVSAPLVQYYYTQMVGDATNPPTLKALASFKGMAVIDSDPYNDDGSNWWVNQNNFFRQVRNFVIDLTAMDVSAGAGIHWQVAQATSLQNIVFNMRTDGGAANKQQGIFMDNGSGGFMSDLVFNGGSNGAFFGNQQFTTRNLTFNGCQTAIFMNWNWAWTLKDITIDNCQVGINMANTSAAVGIVMLIDSTISNTPVGVQTNYDTSSAFTNGSLIIDNVDMSSNVPIAVQDLKTSATLLAGNAKISSYLQSSTYTTAGVRSNVQAAQTAPVKPDSLLNAATGSVFARSKPQYEDVAVTNFISIKGAGAVGDGVTDDTAAIQAALTAWKEGQVIYFDHGAYIVTDTIKVPADCKMVGEIWPMIMAKGDKFTDQANPIPVFQVGQAGDKGAVEMSDMLFQTLGPLPGAIMIEWNLAESSQGSSGMWDVHTRIGGSAGTLLELDQCAKNPNATHAADTACIGAFMLLHITDSASGVYLENTWFWVADHSLEPAAESGQIDIYNGRGVLIESQGPVWMYGTAAEHSQLYNYQLNNASAVYMTLIQTETAYMQGNPDANTPFTANTVYNDPVFTSCAADDATCARTWGLRVVNSQDVFVYGAGLYSFFDNYDQDCLLTQSCQTNIASIESSVVHLFGLNTKASVNMLTVDGKSVATDSDNRNNYCATVGYFSSQA